MIEIYDLIVIALQNIAFVNKFYFLKKEYILPTGYSIISIYHWLWPFAFLYGMNG